MGFRYVILGAGRQGVSMAYDLARAGEAERITLADADVNIARRALMRLATLLPGTRCEFAAARCDVRSAAEVEPVLAGAHVVVSAVPYRFNEQLTDAAIAAGASFCDLGGNTGVVMSQLARHQWALARGVSVVPDCGLAPGLGNILAADGILALDRPRHVHVRCGGLPQRPVGPLGYKLVFNFEGLINEYSGAGEFLRGGQRVSVPALTEPEEIDFPPPLGRCEAAVTSGGTSTCPMTWHGRVETYDYKTVRYPGHFAVVRALFELGCFEERCVAADGATLEPRRVLRELFESRLSYPDVRDLVVLRCTVSGEHGGRPTTRVYNLLDLHDEKTGFTAMERTTGFPAALVAYMQARGVVPPGARPLEVAVPPAQYLAELAGHDVRVTLDVHTGDAPAAT
ncbi:MAG: saccharopine dehydrogenase NADP-binding domain-containing protein [Phycisphaerales bacterium]|nr:saccharopine dehydrogenase NADP-binding domain-containing protein [Phycisphaerales bacterium]